MSILCRGNSRGSHKVQTLWRISGWTHSGFNTSKQYPVLFSYIIHRYRHLLRGSFGATADMVASKVNQNLEDHMDNPNPCPQLADMGRHAEVRRGAQAVL
jgi:hypothetical protein